MTDKEVLEKYLSTAEAGGCNWPYVLPFSSWWREYEAGEIRIDSFTAILFDHEWAKAVWGDKEWLVQYQPHPASHATDSATVEEWQYRLRQLATTPPQDRINYLRENMPK